LERNPDVPDPDGHGWTKDEGSPKLGIDWMHGQPAPDSVLELLACKCKKECKAGECICLYNGLKCTYMYKHVETKKRMPMNRMIMTLTCLTWTGMMMVKV